ncbi:MAG: hypothetical protein ACJ788_03635 [Ktedonobacteraceae bacterium]|jgi:hypothetical protein
MNEILSLLYPILNVIVTGIFAAVVLGQYVRRHRPYQLYWTIALTMAFIATVAYVCMIVVQPTSAAGVLFFRLYYILGAALMPAWLGLGSIALVASARYTRICLAVLCVLSALATLLIASAPVDMTQLSQIAGTPGAGILQPKIGAWLITIIILNTLGVIAVVGVAIYSGWKMKFRQGAGHLLLANVLILAGDILNALAGTTARLGIKNIFWLVMVFGWTVFFVGVLLASRPRTRAVAPKQDSPTTNAEASRITTIS